MIKRIASLATTLLLGLAASAAAQFCPTCIQNSANPQNAQFNVSSGVIRGTLDVSSGVFTNLSVTNLTVASLAGNGSLILSLNASQLTSGNIPTGRLSGAYSGITGLGTIASGVWNGSVVGTQYGGTGQNFVTAPTGDLLYFSAPGVMAVLAPSTAGQILQTNGAAAPSWTAAPQILGTNVSNIPLANLLSGNLPMSIAVNDASISTVSAAKVIGNISGGASSLTTPLPIGNLASGILPTSIVATSITVTGIAPGTYGGPIQIPQFTVRPDGRLSFATQYLISVPPSFISTGTIPVGVTIPAAQVSTGTLHDYVIATHIADNGVGAGVYGDAQRTVQLTIGADGRVYNSTQTLIQLNTNQILAGALPLNVTVNPTTLSTGTLHDYVIATHVANSGVSPGIYGNFNQIPQFTVGADGRITSAQQFLVPGISTVSVSADKDNNWGHSQTSQEGSSWTFHGDISAETGLFLNVSGNGGGLTNISPFALSTGTLPFGVTASSIAANTVTNGQVQVGANIDEAKIANLVSDLASKLNLTGGTLTGTLIVSSNVVVLTSVTASAFFGDGSHLTGIATANVITGTGTAGQLSYFDALNHITSTGAMTINGTTIRFGNLHTPFPTSDVHVVIGDGTRAFNINLSDDPVYLEMAGNNSQAAIGFSNNGNKKYLIGKTPHGNFAIVDMGVGASPFYIEDGTKHVVIGATLQTDDIFADRELNIYGVTEMRGTGATQAVSANDQGTLYFDQGNGTRPKRFLASESTGNYNVLAKVVRLGPPGSERPIMDANQVVFAYSDSVMQSSANFQFNGSSLTLNTPMLVTDTITAHNFVGDGSGLTGIIASSGSANPTGPAGGDLTGTYPNPTIPTLGVLGISTNSLQVQITALDVSTANLQSQINTNSVSIGQLGVSTGSLQTQINNIVVSSASLQTQVAALSIATASLQAQLVNVGISTASLQSQITVNSISIGQLGISTGSLQIQLANVGASTAALHNIDLAIGTSTGSLQIQITAVGASTATESTARIAGDNALAVSTASLQIQITAVGASTATESTARIAGDNALAVSTASLQIQITGIGVSTQSLQSQINSISSASVATQLLAIAVSTASLQTQITALVTSTNTIQIEINGLFVSTGNLQQGLVLVGASTNTLNQVKASTGTNNDITDLDALTTIAGPFTVDVGSVTFSSAALILGNLTVNTGIVYAQGGEIDISSVTSNPTSYLRLGRNSSNSSFITNSNASGVLNFMPGKANPQLLMGDASTTGSSFIDASSGRPMNINTLSTGTVTIGIITIDKNGNITTTSSVTASAFFGNGSGLTNVTATPGGSAGGDLSGTYPNPTIPTLSVLGISTNSLQIQLNNVATTTSTIASSTGTLQANDVALSLSTAALKTTINLIGTSTGSLQIQLTNVGADTATNHTQIVAVGASTNTLNQVKASTGTNNDIIDLDALTGIAGPFTVDVGSVSVNKEIISKSSITAGGFFGNGQGLTGLHQSSFTVIPNQTFTNTAFSCLTGSTVTFKVSTGSLVAVSFTGVVLNNTSGDHDTLGILIDGVFTTTYGSNGIIDVGVESITGTAINHNASFNQPLFLDSLAFGSHTACLLALVNAGTGTIVNTASSKPIFGIMELK